jgi:dTDP-4-amino-4,6-dideoxygalactose transaminase
MSIVSNKPTITRKDLEGVLDCLINDELTSGTPVSQFEKSLSELTSYKFSLAVNSATAAYHLALKALNISKDDEVILPSYFNPAALNAIALVEATAVIIDIDDNSFISTVESYKEKISEKTKAVIIGHTGGVSLEKDDYQEITTPIIEDISHCLGIESAENHNGYFGQICISSFSPNDMITTGNGGAIFTNNSRHFSAMKELRSAPVKLNYEYTMTDFQAAMGISQLSRLQDFIKRRVEIARSYYERSRVTPHTVLFPFSENHIYQSFPIIFDAKADDIKKFFKKNGIELYAPVETPLHVILEEKAMNYPNADRLSKKMYSLPIYPTLTKKEIDKIGRTLAKFI